MYEPSPGDETWFDLRDAMAVGRGPWFRGKFIHGLERSHVAHPGARPYRYDAPPFLVVEVQVIDLKGYESRRAWVRAAPMAVHTTMHLSNKAKFIGMILGIAPKWRPRRPTVTWASKSQHSDSSISSRSIMVGPVPTVVSPLWREHRTRNTDTRHRRVRCCT